MGLPELGLDGGALRNMTCSAAIRRTSPPEIRTASMEMRYLPRIVPPASATNAQSTEAITAPGIATARLNRGSAPRVNPAKDGISLTGPSIMKNTVKINEKCSIDSSCQLPLFHFAASIERDSMPPEMIRALNPFCSRMRVAK